MPLFTETRLRALPIFTGLLFMLGVPLIVALLVQYDYLQDLERVSNERLALYERTLNSALQRYEYLPYLVSQTSMIKELVTKGGNKLEVNVFLQAANDKAESAAIYVLNTKGVVVAASNWTERDSFIGLDLSFRPYFKDAMDGHGGKFFGVGIMAGEPGFYLSHPIRVRDDVVGVVATKVVLSPLETLWQEGGENGLRGRRQRGHRALQPSEVEVPHARAADGRNLEPDSRPLAVS